MPRTTPADSDPHQPKTPANSGPTLIKQLMEVLMELRRQGHTVTIRICPHCKSPAIRSGETYYDIGGAMGITPPKYRCPRCGYWSRIIIEATNDDIDETLLDDLISAEHTAAQKLLKEARDKLDKE